MERMTPLERWNGLAWVCTTWLWKGLVRCRGGVFSGHSVPPNTTRSTRQAFSVWVTRHSHFFPRQTKDKPWKHRLRERTNRRLRRQPSKKHSKPMFRARHEFVTCSRTHQGMDTDGLERVTDGLENWVSPKKSPKKPINRVCPCEESTDEPTQSGISTTDQRQTAMGHPTTPETVCQCQVHLGRL